MYIYYKIHIIKLHIIILNYTTLVTVIVNVGMKTHNKTDPNAYYVAMDKVHFIHILEFSCGNGLWVVSKKLLGEEESRTAHIRVVIFLWRGEMHCI